MDDNIRGKLTARMARRLGTRVREAIAAQTNPVYKASLEADASNMDRYIYRESLDGTLLIVSVMTDIGELPLVDVTYSELRGGLN